jgi:thioredoxin-related protein
VEAGLRAPATPTLVLVDRTGAILDAWEGAGPPERQAAIVKAVEAVLR